MRKTFTRIAAALGMLLLILDGKTAIIGARDGMDLCIRVLIPSLFPFFVLSSLLTGSLLGHSLRILRPLCLCCGIPVGGESLLAVGMLGGYPVGAQNIAAAYRDGNLQKSDAERLLGFCSNAGPAFLFGVLGEQFSRLYTVWLLWLVHIVSALMVGFVSRVSAGQAASSREKSISLTSALERSLRGMASVCGWVVLFRVVIAFLNRWLFWLLPDAAQVFLTGLLELSNGCVRLSAVEPEGLRFVIAGVLLSLGGICVTMQTVSVTQGISLNNYCCGKVLQSLFSFFLCLALQIIFPINQRIRISPLFSVSAAMIALILIRFLRQNKKISRFPAAIGV